MTLTILTVLLVTYGFIFFAAFALGHWWHKEEDRQHGRSLEEADEWFRNLLNERQP